MRRVRSAHRSTIRVLGIVVLIVFVTLGLSLAGVGCAEKGPPRKRFPKGQPPAHKEIIRPAEQEAPPPTTPQTVASRRLVESGLTHLDNKNYELAAVRFQDAINVDPRNGPAYYYLALTDFYLEQYDEAIGLLDKAKVLLGSDPKWLERIENLRASILTDETTRQPTPEPI